MQLLLVIPLLATMVASFDARAQSVLGVVRDADGKPVEGARVTFWEAQPESLPWRTATLAAEHRGLSRSDGRFRFGVTATTGCLWIEHPERGAAMVPRAHPGVPVSVRLEPPATLGYESEHKVIWHLRAVLSQSESVLVRSFAGHEAIRVPAGRYQVLVEHLLVREVTLAPGESRILTRPRHRPRHSLPGGGMTLPDWPRAGPLPHALHVDRTALPPSDVPIRVAESVDTQAGPLRILHEYDGKRTPPTESARANWRAILIRDEKTKRPLDGIDVYAVEQVGARMRVRSAARTNELGAAPVVSPTGEDSTFVVLHRNGAAPIAFPQPIESPLEVTFVAAATVLVRVQVEEPLLTPPAIVRVDQEPWQFMPRFVTTNPRGEAWIDELLPGRTVISVQHPNYRVAERELVAGETDRLVVELDPGLAIHGTVLRDGEPLTGAILELRDAEGRTASGTRIVASGPDGTFRIPGLDDGEYTLFAQFQDGATTWSQRLSAVTANESPIRLALESEDPPPPDRRRDQ